MESHVNPVGTELEIDSHVPPVESRSWPVIPVLTALVLLAATAWAFWPTLVATGKSWYSNPEYSHGFVVPLFSAYLLYRWRGALRKATFAFSMWGVLFFFLAAGLRVVAASLGVDYLDDMALLATLFGIVALVSGWAGVRWAWPSILFLGFMFPLPFSLAYALSGSLRSIATQASGFLLQMVGFPVIIEGHVLLLGEHQIAVAEACSGLSMLFVFLALATAVAILIQRPWFDRLVIMLSAIPIAIIANCLRIAATAFAYQMAGREMGDFIFHDLAGWIMMPLALGMMWIVLKLIDFVLPPSEDDDAPLALAGLGTPTTGQPS